MGMWWGHCGGLFIPGENSGPVSLGESAMQTGCAQLREDFHFSDHAGSFPCGHTGSKDC